MDSTLSAGVAVRPRRVSLLLGGGWESSLDSTGVAVLGGFDCSLFSGTGEVAFLLGPLSLTDLTNMNESNQSETRSSGVLARSCTVVAFAWL